MTERGRRHGARTRDRFTVGPSSVSFEDDRYLVHVNEITVPWLRRLRGEICLRAPHRFDTAWHLDAQGRHRWQPIAPSAELTVDFEAPDLRWRGSGYLDSNWGEEPLEKGFHGWHWSRAPVADGAILSYDAERRDGSRLDLGLRYRANGDIEIRDSAPDAGLPTTGWRVPRRIRSFGAPRVRHTAEDTPFYARTMVDGELEGARVQMMQESLDLDRFASRWVQTLLPFRMPRRL